MTQDEEHSEAPRISRRRWGSGRHARPRPLSDYSQLASRSLSIPEDTVAVDPPGEDSVDGIPPASKIPIPTGLDPTGPASSRRGGRRRRPISVTEGVSFYGPRQTEDIENLLTQVRSGVHLPSTKDPPAFLPLSSLQTKPESLSFFLLFGGPPSTHRLFLLPNHLSSGRLLTNPPLSCHLQ